MLLLFSILAAFVGMICASIWLVSEDFTTWQRPLWAKVVLVVGLIHMAPLLVLIWTGISLGAARCH